MNPEVGIYSSRHWSGDPRLNRHRSYLEGAGHVTEFVSFSTSRRSASTLRVMAAVARTPAKIVILPDPDVFLPAGLIARLRGKRPVIDIHEDYPRAASARPWVPAALRPMVRWAARLSVAAGRLVAWRVMVAAPQLARSGDVVVLNVPDPTSFGDDTTSPTETLVYVGDLTEARGALDMVRLLTLIDESITLLLIGGADDQTTASLDREARRLGVSDRVEMTGRLVHEDAWRRAEGSLAGLSLLQPAPAYLDAVATKLWEYMASGLPPIVSDLPGQAYVVSQIDPELVCGSLSQAAKVVSSLRADPDRRAALASKGRELLAREWASHRPDLAIQGLFEP